MAKVSEIQEEMSPGERVPAPSSFDLTLGDFCRQLSAKKLAPELIGGFHHAMTHAGNLKSSTLAFESAFNRFVTTPA